MNVLTGATGLLLNTEVTSFLESNCLFSSEEIKLMRMYLLQNVFNYVNQWQ